MSAQVRRLDRGENIACRHWRRIFLAKQVADPPEDITAVIERNYLHRLRHWNPSLKIDHGKRVTADRNSKGIQFDNLSILIAEGALGDDRLSRSGFLETKPAQSGRTSGEESLTDRERQINLVDLAVAIAIARVE